MGEKTVILTVLTSETSVAEELIEYWGGSDDRGQAATVQEKLRRSNSALGRAGLHALLYRYTGRGDWKIRADSQGKLSAVSPSGGAGPAICLAHTGRTVACGLAETDALGVDIERHLPRSCSAIAEYAFGAEERRLVAAQGAKTFYRIWTLREAMGKATGEGLTLAADGQDKVNEGPRVGLWSKNVGPRPWLLGHYQIENDLSLSVAAVLPRGGNPRDWCVTWLDGPSLLARA